MVRLPPTMGKVGICGDSTVQARLTTAGSKESSDFLDSETETKGRKSQWPLGIDWSSFSSQFPSTSWEMWVWGTSAINDILPSSILGGRWEGKKEERKQAKRGSLAWAQSQGTKVCCYPYTPQSDASSCKLPKEPLSISTPKRNEDGTN